MTPSSPTPGVPPASPTRVAAAETRAVHAGMNQDSQHGAVVPPIYLTSTFTFDGFDGKREYDYTRSGNPTRTQLARAIADLEGGSAGIVTNTGMSAITLVLQLLKPGDLVIAPHDCYGGTHRLLRALSGRGHFDLCLLDLTSCDADLEIARRRPRFVWIETPSNPLLRITDIARLAAVAHAAGGLVIVDNTFLSPARQQPLRLGADIVVHSTTKYINGHSDVVGGAVIVADAAVGEALAWWANCLGLTGAPFDSYLTLRGIRTLFVRVAQHDTNAAAIASMLHGHEAVSQVYFPGHLAHPGHHVACAQQRTFGAMVSFELRGGPAATKAFLGALQYFTLAESLGGVESLVAHPATMTHAAMDAEAQRAAGISSSLVRLSVGIERGSDLLDDLRQALAQAEV
ncbi:MAG: cystathionine gamma-synthase [Gemmatimonadaceae bacterium]